VEPTFDFVKPDRAER